jgi:hypothetical protein
MNNQNNMSCDMREDSVKNTQLLDASSRNNVILFFFSQLLILFFLSVCTGAYATFSIISRSTVTVVHSITVSYSGPG